MSRRLNTMQARASGILGIKPPKSKAPENIEFTEVGDSIDRDELENAIKSGGICANAYYGCWKIWGSADGYSGELFQYRAITDQFKNQPFDFASAKAIEWAIGCCG